MKFVGISEVSGMKKFIKLAYFNSIKWFFPWIAMAVTALPYSDSRSLFLGRLIALVEEKRHGNG